MKYFKDLFNLFRSKRLPLYEYLYDSPEYNDYINNKTHLKKMTPKQIIDKLPIYPPVSLEACLAASDNKMLYTSQEVIAVMEEYGRQRFNEGAEYAIDELQNHEQTFCIAKSGKAFACINTDFINHFSKILRK